MKYILGGGIAGLIYHFYNSEYKIICKEPGGKLGKSIMKSIVYLHDTKHSRSFLTELGLDINPSRYDIRYFYGGKLHSGIPVEKRKKMIMKKMLLFGSDQEVIDTTLSVKKNYIPVLDIDIEEVVKILLEFAESKENLIKGTITKITQNQIYFSGKHERYSQLVSTLPAHLFWKLYSGSALKPLLEYYPVTFVIADKPPLEGMKEKEIIYFVDSLPKYTRVNNVKGDFLYEFTGEIKESNVKYFIPKGSKIKEYYIDNFGIIKSNFNNIPPPRVTFLGRFSMWEHSQKIQNYIRSAANYSTLRDMWNDQKCFNTNFIDFNNTSLEYRQRLTKEFVLNLQSEVGEVLENINWKMHKINPKGVKPERILEELIDVFKFWMGLAQVWNFSVEDIIEEYYRKSRIVLERMKGERCGKNAQSAEKEETSK